MAKVVYMNFEEWLNSRKTAEFAERMKKRAAAMRATRVFFESRGFLSVETPTVVRLPGMEPNLDPMRTSVRPQGGKALEAWLITSPEYSLKKILAAGYERVFEITRSFRDGEPWEAGQHNPEFTMLEWYRSGEDYRALMSDVEEMVEAVAVEVTGSPVVSYKGHKLDLAAPWPRLSVAAAMEQHAGLDLNRAIEDPDWFRAEVRGRGFVVPDNESFDDMFFRVFLRDVEPNLGIDKPVILYDYPVSMAALARIKPDDSRYAERVEVYCAGLELANGFSELTDEAEQRTRLESERRERREMGRADIAVDEDFLLAVGKMSPAAGIAFGLDRLVMLLTDAPSIREVLFFPAEAVWNDKETS